MKRAALIFKICWYLTAVALAVATFMEQLWGKAFIHEYFYEHWIFCTCISLFILLGVVLSFCIPAKQNSRTTKCLHLTPLFLLVGSLISFGWPWGKYIVFFGYAWFVIFYVALLARKDGEFRSLLKKLSLLIIPIALFPLQLTAQKTISREVAAEMEDVVVYYEGREAPLLTLCNDYLFDIYGDTEYKNFNSIQVVMGWVMFPEEWISEPIMKISGREMRQKLHCGKYASPAEILVIQEDEWPESINKQDKDFQKVVTKLMELQYLRSGKAFTIFPYHGRWYSAADFPSTLPEELQCEYNDFFKILYNNTIENKNSDSKALIELLKQRQAIPTAVSSRIESEVRYHHWRLALGPWWVSLILAILLFTLYIYTLAKKASKSYLLLIFRILCVLQMVLVLVHWFWRWWLCEHIPLGNGYDTLLFLSLLILLITNILWNKNPLIPFAGTLLSSLSLLVMNFSFNTPKISSLPQILDSPWLSLHVTIIMAAYALLAFTCIIAIIFLIMKLLRKSTSSIGEQLTDLSRVMLLPGIGFLAIGIMLGSVWGDSAWGHYWNWDPKEVWSLITFMVYAPAAQPRFFRSFQRNGIYHLYLILSFICLLMTYFGVNYWLGGLHSYA